MDIPHTEGRDHTHTFERKEWEKSKNVRVDGSFGAYNITMIKVFILFCNLLSKRHFFAMFQSIVLGNLIYFGKNSRKKFTVQGICN